MTTNETGQPDAVAVYCIWYGQHEASLQRIYASREAAERWIAGLNLVTWQCDRNNPDYHCIDLQDADDQFVDAIGGGDTEAEARQRVAEFSITDEFKVEETRVYR